MKKQLSFLTALLLLLSLTACGTAPAKNEPNQDSSETQTGKTTESSGTFTPVTTEEEVRALYANAEIISVEEYQGSFLVTLGGGLNPGCTYLDWVYGQSGIRRRMLWLDEPIISCKILEPAAVRVVSGGPNAVNGVLNFPTLKCASLNLLYDELGREINYNYYTDPFSYETRPYWAGAGESYCMGMQGRREAVRSAQIDAGGVTVAFAPLADDSDFEAAYRESPYIEVGLSQDGMTLTVTMHDTFLDCGKLGKDVDTALLKEYGSLYPESFPAGELTGSCTLIEKAELHQDGNNVILTVTLADGPIRYAQTFADGHYYFTADTGYTGIVGIGGNGPYFRLQLRVADSLCAN